MVRVMRQSWCAARTLALLVFLAGSPHAGLGESVTNPSGTITILGDATFTLSAPSAPLPVVFSVRVVDSQGNPAPGLTIEFFTNQQLCIPLDPNCSTPEGVVYGHFANDSGEVDALTDANGIATAAFPYIGGYEPGTYTVAAFISLSASDANYAFIKNGSDLSILYAIDQVFAASPTLDGYMSGNWYNPEQPGQGFQLEFTNDGTALAIWFTYAPNGSGQNWILATNSYDNTLHSVNLNAVLDRGARFPPAFRSQDVTQTYWGSLMLTLTDCNHGRVSWSSFLPQYATGTMPITRLTSIDGVPCPH